MQKKVQLIPNIIIKLQIRAVNEKLRTSVKSSEPER